MRFALREANRSLTLRCGQSAPLASIALSALLLLSVAAASSIDASTPSTPASHCSSKQVHWTRFTVAAGHW